MIQALQYFTQAYVAASVAGGSASAAGTQSNLELGYPQGSTLFYPVLLYYQGFRFFNMGYAVGDGDPAAPRRLLGDAPDPAQLATLGPLPGRGSMSASQTPASRPPPLVRRQLPPAVRRHRLLVAIADHSLLIAAAIIFLLPVVFIFLTSLMTSEQALSPKLWPDPFQWGNYREVFSSAPVWRWALNSFIYSGLATLGLLDLERPRRLCARPAALARARGCLPRRARGADAAATGHGRAALRDVGEAAPRRHAVAADPAELARRRVRDLPPAPVLPHDPARSISTRPGSTAAASSGS